MIRSRIAQRYARALFELAQEGGKIDTIGNELAAIQEVIGADESLRTALHSPVLTRTQKARVVDILLDAAEPDPMVNRFIRVLLDARKLPLLSDIVSVYSDMADAASGRVKGEAVTLSPLNKPEVDALEKALSQALEKEVQLTSRLDTSLLGGVVVRVGNLVFDNSLRTQLRRMKDTLIKG